MRNPEFNVKVGTGSHPSLKTANIGQREILHLDVGGADDCAIVWQPSGPEFQQATLAEGSYVLPHSVGVAKTTWNAVTARAHKLVRGLGRGRLVIESAVAATLVMTLALLLDPSAPGHGSLRPHLMWIAVLVFAAQYGSRGLIGSLSASVLGLTLASIAVGESLSWLVARATNTTELVTFAGSIAVAWVAGGHERRKATLASEKLAHATRAEEAQASFGDLCVIADDLVRQIDRSQLSVSYLRSLAERIDGGTPAISADAALELALSRIGARSGAVMIHDGRRLRVIARRGGWSVDPTPADDTADRAGDRGLSHGRIAVPVFGPDGKPVGMIVVRDLGVDLDIASTTNHDRAVAELAAIARWISRPLAKAARAKAVTGSANRYVDSGGTGDADVVPIKERAG